MFTRASAAQTRFSDGRMLNSGDTASPWLRDANSDDLEQINSVISRAMDSWQIAPRVRRISLPLYQYDRLDLQHLQTIVAEFDNGDLAGVATLESADLTESPQGLNAALLHGLYVDPAYHRQGIGSCLLQRIESLAKAASFDGLLVKANRDARPFFDASGMERLAVIDSARDYPYRYWQSW